MEFFVDADAEDGGHVVNVEVEADPEGELGDVVAQLREELEQEKARYKQLQDEKVTEVEAAREKEQEMARTQMEELKKSFGKKERSKVRQELQEQVKPDSQYALVDVTPHEGDVRNRAKFYLLHLFNPYVTGL